VILIDPRREARGSAMTKACEKPDGQNDRESALLQRVAKQDRDAITELYRIYHARLFKFIFRLTRSYAAADELVNDIMLLVWQNAAAFRGESRVSTWIFGIAYRQAMRRVSRNQVTLSQHAELEELPCNDNTDIETEDWVWRGLHALPAAQQLTVILVFYVGLSYAETAEVIRCPVNTVKTRMFHARSKLRKYLAESATANTANTRGMGGTHATR
jgi:RNA polymerase sigma-70 factor (ECF subfamily)